MTYPSSWSDWAALCGVVATVWGITGVALHAFLARSFASRRSLEAAELRIHQLELTYSRLPTHADLAALKAKVSHVSNKISEVGATMVAVQHTANLLLKHQLGEA